MSIDELVEDGDQCPVCGWSTIRSEGVPEHPDGDHPYGTLFVHTIESKGRAGQFKIGGCTLYSDGKTDTWDPEE